MLGRLPDEMREKLPDELVDELLAGAKTEEEIVGPGGLLSQMTKRGGRVRAGSPDAGLLGGVA